jgi:hypothetical protein
MTASVPSDDRSPGTDPWGIDARYHDVGGGLHEIDADVVASFRSIIGEPRDAGPLVVPAGRSVAADRRVLTL